jgi:hypothetical protein
MGINGLLVEHKRRQHSLFNPHNNHHSSSSNYHHYQQHANALRALNASQPSLTTGKPLTLQMEGADEAPNMLRRPASAGAMNRNGSQGAMANYSVIMRDKKVG